MASPREFGVQSFCFRNFKDNDDVAAKVKEIGLSSIEVCAVHADFNDPAAHDGVIASYKNAGVDIVSIGVQTFTGNEAVERNWFEFAKKAGAKYISAHFNVDTFDKAVPAAVKLCDEYDIKIGIHCHGGYRFGGSPDVIDHLLKIGGPRIGVNIDTAWCMQIGPRQGQPVEWVKRFGERVYGVHYKDFVFDKSAKWEDVIVGTGNLDLPAFIAALEEIGFDGYPVIEYEANPENPVPALKECVSSMRSA
ncbi:MAG: sugar phosphate isomerase/epimerase [Planctomycetota bacterium]|jgi:sugar phosphate isomerase/epimerase|nr:sugar phosphate isomerase/epimerase [Planctomycetota bacterium]